MLKFYQFLSKNAGKPLNSLLQSRADKGKEIPGRLNERRGTPTLERPDGPLIWVHAASVGEAQSALILINRLLQSNSRLHVLLTSGTVTSAKLMAQKLPDRAFHQFYPLDHPDWAQSFLDHWNPEMALWLESELWPNMLLEMKKRNIPAVLINARLSDKSFRAWAWFKKSVAEILQSFALVLAQTERDAARFKKLGADNVFVTGNIKYSAHPLPCDEDELRALRVSLQNRPCWVFASTHKGEEDMACRIHQVLKNSIPRLLTIIIPRHPDRRSEIQSACESSGLNTTLRGEHKNHPDRETDIYIADTMGELGLFYRLAPVACIGRSFSDDGGGGHNPIEAAQLNCAVLHGPNVQFQKDIYLEMNEDKAALRTRNENELTNAILELLENEEKRLTAQKKAYDFAKNKEGVVEHIMDHLSPLLSDLENSRRINHQDTGT